MGVSVRSILVPAALLGLVLVGAAGQPRVPSQDTDGRSSSPLAHLPVENPSNNPPILPNLQQLLPKGNNTSGNIQSQVILPRREGINQHSASKFNRIQPNVSTSGFSISSKSANVRSSPIVDVEDGTIKPLLMHAIPTQNTQQENENRGTTTKFTPTLHIIRKAKAVTNKIQSLLRKFNSKMSKNNNDEEETYNRRSSTNFFNEQHPPSDNKLQSQEESHIIRKATTLTKHLKALLRDRISNRNLSETTENRNISIENNEINSASKTRTPQNLPNGNNVNINELSKQLIPEQESYHNKYVNSEDGTSRTGNPSIDINPQNVNSQYKSGVTGKVPLSGSGHETPELGAYDNTNYHSEDGTSYTGIPSDDINPQNVNSQYKSGVKGKVPLSGSGHETPELGAYDNTNYHSEDGTSHTGIPSDDINPPNFNSQYKSGVTGKVPLSGSGHETPDLGTYHNTNYHSEDSTSRTGIPSIDINPPNYNSQYKSGVTGNVPLSGSGHKTPDPGTYDNTNYHSEDGTSRTSIPSIDINPPNYNSQYKSGVTGKVPLSGSGHETPDPGTYDNKNYHSEDGTSRTGIPSIDINPPNFKSQYKSGVTGKVPLSGSGHETPDPGTYDNKNCHSEDGTSHTGIPSDDINPPNFNSQYKSGVTGKVPLSGSGHETPELGTYDNTNYHSEDGTSRTGIPSIDINPANYNSQYKSGVTGKVPLSGSGHETPDPGTYDNTNYHSEDGTSRTGIPSIDINPPNFKSQYKSGVTGKVPLSGSGHETPDPGTYDNKNYHSEDGTSYTGIPSDDINPLNFNSQYKSGVTGKVPLSGSGHETPDPGTYDNTNYHSEDGTLRTGIPSIDINPPNYNSQYKSGVTGKVPLSGSGHETPDPGTYDNTNYHSEDGTLRTGIPSIDIIPPNFKSQYKSGVTGNVPLSGSGHKTPDPGTYDNTNYHSEDGTSRTGIPSIDINPPNYNSQYKSGVTGKVPLSGSGHETPELGTYDNTNYHSEDGTSRTGIPSIDINPANYNSQYKLGVTGKVPLSGSGHDIPDLGTYDKTNYDSEDSTSRTGIPSIDINPPNYNSQYKSGVTGKVPLSGSGHETPELGTYDNTYYDSEDSTSRTGIPSIDINPPNYNSQYKSRVTGKVPLRGSGHETPELGTYDNTNYQSEDGTSRTGIPSIDINPPNYNSQYKSGVTGKVPLSGSGHETPELGTYDNTYYDSEDSTSRTGIPSIDINPPNYNSQYKSRVTGKVPLSGSGHETPELGTYDNTNYHSEDGTLRTGIPNIDIIPPNFKSQYKSGVTGNVPLSGSGHKTPDPGTYDNTNYHSEDGTSRTGIPSIDLNHPNYNSQYKSEVTGKVPLSGSGHVTPELGTYDNTNYHSEDGTSYTGIPSIDNNPPNYNSQYKSGVTEKVPPSGSGHDIPDLGTYHNTNYHSGDSTSRTGIPSIDINPPNYNSQYKSGVTGKVPLSGSGHETPELGTYDNTNYHSEDGTSRTGIPSIDINPPNYNSQYKSGVTGKVPLSGSGHETPELGTYDNTNYHSEDGTSRTGIPSIDINPANYNSQYKLGVTGKVPLSGSGHETPELGTYDNTNYHSEDGTSRTGNPSIDINPQNVNSQYKSGVKGKVPLIGSGHETPELGTYDNTNYHSEDGTSRTGNPSIDINPQNVNSQYKSGVKGKVPLIGSGHETPELGTYDNTNYRSEDGTSRTGNPSIDINPQNVNSQYKSGVKGKVPLIGSGHETPELGTYDNTNYQSEDGTSRTGNPSIDINPPNFNSPYKSGVTGKVPLSGSGHDIPDLGTYDKTNYDSEDSTSRTGIPSININPPNYNSQYKSGVTGKVPLSGSGHETPELGTYDNTNYHSEDGTSRTGNPSIDINPQNVNSQYKSGVKGKVPLIGSGHETPELGTYDNTNYHSEDGTSRTGNPSIDINPPNFNSQYKSGVTGKVPLSGSGHDIPDLGTYDKTNYDSEDSTSRTGIPSIDINPPNYNSQYKSGVTGKVPLSGSGHETPELGTYDNTNYQSEDGTSRTGIPSIDINPPNYNSQYKSGVSGKVPLSGSGHGIPDLGTYDNTNYDSEDSTSRTGIPSIDINPPNYNSQYKSGVTGKVPLSGSGHETPELGTYDNTYYDSEDSTSRTGIPSIDINPPNYNSQYESGVTGKVPLSGSGHETPDPGTYNNTNYDSEDSTSRTGIPSIDINPPSYSNQYKSGVTGKVPLSGSRHETPELGTYDDTNYDSEDSTSRTGIPSIDINPPNYNSQYKSGVTGKVPLSGSGHETPDPGTYDNKNYHSEDGTSRTGIPSIDINPPNYNSQYKSGVTGKVPLSSSGHETPELGTYDNTNYHSEDGTSRTGIPSIDINPANYNSQYKSGVTGKVPLSGSGHETPELETYDNTNYHSEDGTSRPGSPRDDINPPNYNSQYKAEVTGKMPPIGSEPETPEQGTHDNADYHYEDSTSRYPIPTIGSKPPTYNSHYKAEATGKMPLSGSGPETPDLGTYDNADYHYEDSTSRYPIPTIGSKPSTYKSQYKSEVTRKMYPIGSGPETPDVGTHVNADYHYEDSTSRYPIPTYGSKPPTYNSHYKSEVTGKMPLNGSDPETPDLGTHDNADYHYEDSTSRYPIPTIGSKPPTYNSHYKAEATRKMPLSGSDPETPDLGTHDNADYQYEDSTSRYPIPTIGSKPPTYNSHYKAEATRKMPLSDSDPETPDLGTHDNADYHYEDSTSRYPIPTYGSNPPAYNSHYKAEVTGKMPLSGSDPETPDLGTHDNADYHYEDSTSRYPIPTIGSKPPTYNSHYKAEATRKMPLSGSGPETPDLGTYDNAAYHYEDSPSRYPIPTIGSKPPTYNSQYKSEVTGKMPPIGSGPETPDVGTYDTADYHYEDSTSRYPIPTYGSKSPTYNSHYKSEVTGKMPPIGLGPETPDLGTHDNADYHYEDSTSRYPIPTIGSKPPTYNSHYKAEATRKMPLSGSGPETPDLGTYDNAAYHYEDSPSRYPIPTIGSKPPTYNSQYKSEVTGKMPPIGSGPETPDVGTYDTADYHYEDSTSRYPIPTYGSQSPTYNSHYKSEVTGKMPPIGLGPETPDLGTHDNADYHYEDHTSRYPIPTYGSKPHTYHSLYKSEVTGKMSPIGSGPETPGVGTHDNADYHYEDSTSRYLIPTIGSKPPTYNSQYKSDVTGKMPPIGSGPETPDVGTYDNADYHYEDSPSRYPIPTIGSKPPTYNSQYKSEVTGKMPPIGSGPETPDVGTHDNADYHYEDHTSRYPIPTYGSKPPTYNSQYKSKVTGKMSPIGSGPETPGVGTHDNADYHYEGSTSRYLIPTIGSKPPTYNSQYKSEVTGKMPPIGSGPETPDVGTYDNADYHYEDSPSRYPIPTIGSKPPTYNSQYKSEVTGKMPPIGSGPETPDVGTHDNADYHYEDSTSRYPILTYGSKPPTYNSQYKSKVTGKIPSIGSGSDTPDVGTYDTADYHYEDSTSRYLIPTIGSKPPTYNSQYKSKVTGKMPPIGLGPETPHVGTHDNADYHYEDSTSRYLIPTIGSKPPTYNSQYKSEVTGKMPPIGSVPETPDVGTYDNSDYHYEDSTSRYPIPTIGSKPPTYNSQYKSEVTGKMPPIGSGPETPDVGTHDNVDYHYEDSTSRYLIPTYGSKPPTYNSQYKSKVTGKMPPIGSGPETPDLRTYDKADYHYEDSTSRTDIPIFDINMRNYKNQYNLDVTGKGLLRGSVLETPEMEEYENTHSHMTNSSHNGNVLSILFNLSNYTNYNDISLPGFENASKNVPEREAHDYIYSHSTMNTSSLILPSDDIFASDYKSKHETGLPGIWSPSDSGHKIALPEGKKVTRDGDSNWNWGRPEINSEDSEEQKIDPNPRSGIPNVDKKPVFDENSDVVEHAFGNKDQDIPSPGVYEIKPKEETNYWSWSLPDLNFNIVKDYKTERSPHSGIPRIHINPTDYSNSEELSKLPTLSIAGKDNEISKQESEEKPSEMNVNGNWDLSLYIPKNTNDYGVPKTKTDITTVENDSNWNWHLPDLKWKTTNGHKMENSPQSGIHIISKSDDVSLPEKSTFRDVDNSGDKNLPEILFSRYLENGVLKSQTDIATADKDSNWNWRLPEFKRNNNKEQEVESRHRSGMPRIEMNPGIDTPGDVSLPEIRSFGEVENKVPKPKTDITTPEKDTNWDWWLPELKWNTTDIHKNESIPRSGMPSTDINSSFDDSGDIKWSIAEVENGVPKPKTDIATPEKHTNWSWRLPEFNWNITNAQNIAGSPRSGMPSMDISLGNAYSGDIDFLGKWSLQNVENGERKTNNEIATPKIDTNWNWQLPEFKWNTTNAGETNTSPRSAMPSIDMKPSIDTIDDVSLPHDEWSIGDIENRVPKSKPDIGTTEKDTGWNWRLPELKWNITNHQESENSSYSGMPSVDMNPTIKNSGDVSLSEKWSIGNVENEVPKSKNDIATPEKDTNWSWRLPEFKWNITNAQKIASSPRSGMPSMDIRPTYAYSGDINLPEKWSIADVENGVPKPETDLATPEKDTNWSWRLPEFNWNITNAQKIASSPRSGMPRMDIRPTYAYSGDINLPEKWSIADVENGVPKPETDLTTPEKETNWSWKLPEFEWNITNAQKIASSPRSGIPSMDIRPTYAYSGDINLPEKWSIEDVENGVPKPETDLATPEKETNWSWKLPEFKWNITNAQKIPSSLRWGIPSMDIRPTYAYSGDINLPEKWSIADVENGVPKPETDLATPEKETNWSWKLPEFKWNITNAQKIASSPRSGIPSMDIRPTYAYSGDINLPEKWSIADVENGVPKPETDLATQEKETNCSWKLPEFKWNISSNHVAENISQSGMPSMDMNPGDVDNVLPKPKIDLATPQKDTSWNWLFPEFQWNTTNDQESKSSSRSGMPSVDMNSGIDSSSDVSHPGKFSPGDNGNGISKPKTDIASTEKDTNWSWWLPEFKWDTTIGQKIASIPRSAMPSLDISPSYAYLGDISLPGKWSIANVVNRLPKQKTDLPAPEKDTSWIWLLPEFKWTTTTNQEAESISQSGIPSVYMNPGIGTTGDVSLPEKWSFGDYENGIPKPNSDIATTEKNTNWSWRLPEFKWNTTGGQKISSNPRSGMPSLDIGLSNAYPSDTNLPGKWSIGDVENVLPKGKTDLATPEKDKSWNWLLPEFQWNTTDGQESKSSSRSGMSHIDMNPTIDTSDVVSLSEKWSIGNIENEVPKPKTLIATAEKDANWRWTLPEFKWNTANNQEAESSSWSGMPRVHMNSGIDPSGHVSQPEPDFGGNENGLPKPKTEIATPEKDANWNWWLSIFNWNTSNNHDMESTPRLSSTIFGVKPTNIRNKNYESQTEKWSFIGFDDAKPRINVADQNTYLESENNGLTLELRERKVSHNKVPRSISRTGNVEHISDESPAVDNDVGMPSLSKTLEHIGSNLPWVNLSNREVEYPSKYNGSMPNNEYSEKSHLRKFNTSIPFSLRGIWNFPSGLNSSINVISLNLSTPLLNTSTEVDFTTLYSTNITNLQLHRFNDSLSDLLSLSMTKLSKAKRNATSTLVFPYSDFSLPDETEHKESLSSYSNLFLKSLSALRGGLNSITKN